MLEGTIFYRAIRLRRFAYKSNVYFIYNENLPLPLNESLKSTVQGRLIKLLISLLISHNVRRFVYVRRLLLTFSLSLFFFLLLLLPPPPFFLCRWPACFLTLRALHCDGIVRSWDFQSCQPTRPDNLIEPYCLSAVHAPYEARLGFF